MNTPATSRQTSDAQPRSLHEVLDAEDAKDAARFQWLIKQGVAWRGCYDHDWLPGEWLYAAQDARHFVDKAMAQAFNDQAEARGTATSANQKPL